MQLKCLLFVMLLPILIAGCGGGGTSSTPGSRLAASQACLSVACHGARGVQSPGGAPNADPQVAGALIGDEWLASAHNLRNAASCADCHEPDAQHPNQCYVCHGGVAVTRDPDSANKCLKCHGPSHPGDALMALAPQHYGYSSASTPGARRASYVSGEYVGRCRACHNPHLNTLTPQHLAYATSLHGDPKGEAWNYYEFKQDNRAACQRCHTSTGYIGYVTSGFTPPTTGFGAGDPSRELLACDACHASYDFKNSIRKVAVFTAPYQNFNGTGQASFPDDGETNLCIPCHSGLDSGKTIEALPASSFSNTGFVNPHYMAAAGLMFMQNGFTAFTSASAAYGTSTYGKSLSPDSASTPGGISGGTTSTHRKLGTPAIVGDSHKPAFFVAGVLDQNGPCVTCHLNASGVDQRTGSGHSLKIDGNAFQQVCINCHPTENTVALTPDNFHDKFVGPQGAAFAASLQLMQTILLQKYMISFDITAFPYFYDENLPTVGGKKQPVTDWTRSVVLAQPVNGRKLMGACYNFNLLTRDPAAFAHARSYSRRLVYDSLDFLDDNIMNGSVGNTAVNSGLQILEDGVLTTAFVKDTQAYNAASGAITTIFGTTSEPMLYLIGWSRTTGSWSVPERP